MRSTTFLGSAYASSAVFSLQNDEVYSSVTISLIISTYVPGFALYVSVAGAIVARLWWMGRTIASLTGTSTNQFAYSIYVVIRSGVIVLTANATVCAPFMSKSPAALTGLDVISQVVVCLQLIPSPPRSELPLLQVSSSFLVVVLVGRTDRYRTLQCDSSQMVPRMQDEIVSQAGVPWEQDLEQDLSHPCILSRSPSLVNSSHV